jgi:hypothetical protein
MPAEDVNACGRRPSPEIERFIRKAVSELGCFGNVVWNTDNEGNLVPSWKREWFEWVWKVIRDEEQRSGCGIAHMIGTNNPDVADGPFDYVATHDRAPLSEPIAGKWTINNERNPQFPPEQEAAYFQKARDQGLAWAFWRADMDDAAAERTLSLFRDVVRGSSASGCFAPPEDDPHWAPGPVRGCPDVVLEALAQAKAEVGDPRPGWAACVRAGETPIACMFPTLDALAESMRRQGLCAGRTRDAITAKPNDSSKTWFEIHATGATDGGYAGTPCKGSTWLYP